MSFYNFLKYVSDDDPYYFEVERGWYVIFSLNLTPFSLPECFPDLPSAKQAWEAAEWDMCMHSEMERHEIMFAEDRLKEVYALHSNVVIGTPESPRIYFRVGAA